MPNNSSISSLISNRLLKFGFEAIMVSGFWKIHFNTWASSASLMPLPFGLTP
jgi:hypothetical protein